MEDLVRTKPPVNSILLLLLTAMVVVLPVFDIVWIIYMPFIWIFFYVFFCRYCCIVAISSDDFEIRYFAPWMKNLKLNLQNIEKMDYAKGYYDLSAKKAITTMGMKMFPLYPYDRLILFLKNSQSNVIYANVNTRMFDFDKVLNWASDRKKLVI